MVEFHLTNNNTTREERRKIAYQDRIKTMKPVLFICERDWSSPRGLYQCGFMWNKKLDAEEGEHIYQRQCVVRWAFHLSFRIGAR